MLRPEIAFMDITLPASSALLAYYYATVYVNGVGSLPSLFTFILATIGGFFAITGSYVFNDCFDVDIDSINLPNRPLPSGDLTIKNAFTFATALALIAAIISFYLNPESFSAFILAFVVITLYSWFFKRVTPFSFIPVGIAYGLVPIGIWLAFDPAGILKTSEIMTPEILPLPAIFFGLMICMTDWGFTLAGVSRDVKGDREKGAPTFPVTYGIPKTTRFITIIWTIGILFSVAIGYTSKLGPAYFVFALLAGLWMLSRCFQFIRNPSPEVGGKLFVEGSNYRGVMFSAMIIDIILNIYVSGYTGILW